MKRRKTIENYIQSGYESGLSLTELFFVSTDTFNYDPVDDEAFRDIMAETIEEFYYNFKIDKIFETFDEMRSYIRQRINRTIRREEYTIKWLWDSTQHGDEYNPIENVFEDNTETVTRTPNLTMQDNGGNTQGSQVNNSDSTNKLFAFNSSAFGNADRNDSGETIGSRSDSHNNMHTETGNEVTVYEKNRHGNIGTVTAADLLSGQRDAVRYSFYREVANMLVMSFALDF